VQELPSSHSAASSQPPARTSTPTSALPSAGESVWSAMLARKRSSASSPTRGAANDTTERSPSVEASAHATSGPAVCSQRKGVASPSPLGSQVAVASSTTSWPATASSGRADSSTTGGSLSTLRTVTTTVASAAPLGSPVPSSAAQWSSKAAVS